MSSTGPITWTICPTFRFVSTAAPFTFSLTAVAIITPWCPLSVVAVRRVPCRRATDDLGDLLRDRRLALPVVGPLEDLEDLAGVVGRVLHRGALRAVEARDHLDQPAVDRVPHVERQELDQNRLGTGLEDVV